MNIDANNIVLTQTLIRVPQWMVCGQYAYKQRKTLEFFPEDWRLGGWTPRYSGYAHGEYHHRHHSHHLLWRQSYNADVTCMLIIPANHIVTSSADNLAPKTH